MLIKQTCPIQNNTIAQGTELSDESMSSQASEYTPSSKQEGNFKLTNLLIDFGMIARNLKQLYSEMMEQKNNLIKFYSDEFQNRYVLDAKDFARELVLDMSQCENCLYILPQLTRES